MATALNESGQEEPAGAVVAGLTSAGPVPSADPSTAKVRAWARSHGYDVPDRGRLRPEIWRAFRERTTG